MRFSSSLLLSCASSVICQVQRLEYKRFTNSTTSSIGTTSTIETTSSIGTTSTIETPTTVQATTRSSAPSSLASFELNLRDFTLGQGCSFYPPPDGNSILMSPEPRDDSSLNRRQVPNPLPFQPPNISIAYIRFSLPLRVAYGPLVLVVSGYSPCFGFAACTKKVKRDVPCVFQVLVDNKVVHEEPITPAAGDLNLSTNPFPKKSDYEFTFQLACNNQIVPVILQGVTVRDSPGVVATPISPVIVGTGVAVETSSATTENTTSGVATRSEFETISVTQTTFITSAETASLIKTTAITTSYVSDFTTTVEDETVSDTQNTSIIISSVYSFTTNSMGETISFTKPTGTTSSSVPEVTTDSDSNSVIPTTTTSTVSSSTATSVPGFPTDIFGFTFFGCVASTSGFPTFTSAETSQRMDLDVCGNLCAGSAYFGVYDTTCYCGDTLGVDTSRVSFDQCNIKCPGDDNEFCGGDSTNRLRARQAVPSNRLLTIYAALPDVVVTESVTQTATGKQTLVTTFTNTVTRASTTFTGSMTTTLVCVNSKCYPSASTVYVFTQLNGSQCDGQWVFVSESYPGGHKYVPKFCSQGNCGRLEVYKPQQCYDWYNHNSYFVASDCTACTGNIQYLPWQTSWGTPDNCNEKVPACTGYNCPSPYYGTAPTSDDRNPNSAITHGGSNGSSKSVSGESSSGLIPKPSGNSNGAPREGSSGSSNGSGVSSPYDNGDTSSGSSFGSGASDTKSDSVPSTVSVSGASKQAINILLLAAVFIIFV